MLAFLILAFATVLGCWLGLRRSSASIAHTRDRVPLLLTVVGIFVALVAAWVAHGTRSSATATAAVIGGAIGLFLAVLPLLPRPDSNTDGPK